MNSSVGSGLLARTWRATERHAYGLPSRPIPSKIDSIFVYGDRRRSFSRGGTQPVPKRYRQYVLGKKFASKTSPLEPTSTTIDSATSTIRVDKVLCTSSYRQVERRKISSLVAGAWRVSLQRESLWSLAGIGRRYKSSISGDKPSRGPSDGDIQKDEDLAVPKSQHSALPDSNSPATRHLIDRLPAMPHLHRPTKEELLAAATGFWSRLKVRFKWFSIRSVRPFNMDEIGAFFSWFVLGHVIWIIVGTTTFFSLGIFAINTVFAQETLAGWVGNYLTKSSGVRVVFESAIVPKWGDGVISFKNVFVSRRPGQGKANVSKGSPETAAAAAAAFNEGSKAQMAPTSSNSTEEVEEDTNYTQFDLSIDAVNVTLSFAKWFNGKGLLRDVEVKGIRGVVDRTSVHWTGEYVDPLSYRQEHSPGDFEIDSFKMEDLLVTVYQPNGFRPYSVSIFACDLPQLRKQWLFYDFLSANSMSGSFDNSLFAIHPRQTASYTGAQLNAGAAENGDSNPWKKHSRIRVDGLNIDHLNTGVSGPFSWIHEGNVDIVADVMFPAENDESLAKVVSDFYDRLEATVTSNRDQTISDFSQGEQTTLHDGPGTNVNQTSEDDKRFLVMDLRIHLNDVRAAVPIFTRDLSYVNNALVRPIVAYINSRRTFIPINCRLVKRAGDFDGSWTIYDSGLMDDLSAETYEAFARNVVDDQARKRRFKKVGLWSLQLAVQAIFLGMAGNVA